MKNLISIEFKKVFKSKVYIITLAIFTLLAVLIAIESSYYSVIGENRIKNTTDVNLWLSANTLFSKWVGGQLADGLSMIFYYLLPLVAIIGYSWSLQSEMKSGYIKNIVVRGGKNSYFFSKIIVNFIASGLIVLIPIVVNFIIVACFVPVRMPDPQYDVIYSIYSGDLWSVLFYTNPFVYDLIFIFISFLFAGLWSIVPMAISFFTKNKIASLVTPYIVLLLYSYVMDISGFAYNSSPFSFIKAAQQGRPYNEFVIFGTLLVIACFGIGIVALRGHRDDVF